jgi:hypothetical protein
MAKLRFGVFQVQDGWQLWCQDHQLGRFHHRGDAISAGERAADQASGSGFEVELHIMNPNGELRLADRPSWGGQPTRAVSRRRGQADTAEEAFSESALPKLVPAVRVAPSTTFCGEAGDA